MKRRTFIGTSAAASVGLIACKTANGQDKKQDMGFKLKNNINHSVCHWCFKDIPLEDFLKTLNELGVKAVDLMGPEEWPLLKKYNIHSAMCNGAEIGLTKGWNNPKYHETLIKNYTDIIPKVAKAGYTNLICFSGNRDGMDDQTGLKNCVEGLKQIMPLAEKHGVVLQMELFNQINHPDYMCDTSAWGIELCKALGSENFKLLYDIYHMQIQEGDIIRSIQDNHQYFGHYHTAGVPGRHEIDESQELYYPAIMIAILATGYKGYVAQEFIPAREGKLDSLKQGFLICDV
ncbi:TIM barrel protein [uncultured Maribacter sp.]|uniref:hydroxypyruvate isomerase family protein n=1 Tax=uncultured Maribacter sp. TaxID=431308 RepID=UPI00261822C9|nr:TIM barrel protein [uncultured Maribacter sp.]